MPRHPRRFRKHGAYDTSVQTEEELLAVLERHGFMEVPVGQDQAATDTGQDHSEGDHPEEEPTPIYA